MNEICKSKRLFLQSLLMSSIVGISAQLDFLKILQNVETDKMESIKLLIRKIFKNSIHFNNIRSNNKIINSLNIKDTHDIETFFISHSSKPKEQLLQLLRSKIILDFENDNIVILDGWILSKTEAQIFLLLKTV